MLDFAQFTTLTFDCYGTLIDWEAGIADTLWPLLDERRIKLNRDELIKRYAEFEEIAERKPYKKYRSVLADVVRAFGTLYGFEPSNDEVTSLERSLPTWQPFPDSIDALRRLKTRFKLAVISNIDDDLFAQTSARLGDPFDTVVTAESVGSYKPDPANFAIALDRIGATKSEVLHIAQSLFHDITPANALGLRSVWVNRSGARHGFGATKPAGATPDLMVPDLAALAHAAL